MNLSSRGKFRRRCLRNGFIGLGIAFCTISLYVYALLYSSDDDDNSPLSPLVSTTSPKSAVAVQQQATNKTIDLYREQYKAERAPIFQNYKGKKPVRVRILLFEHERHSIRFRKGPSWAFSDELLNICMDGFQQSPYFDFVNATIIPDFHQEPNFLLKEDEDIVWIVDMRRMVYDTTESIYKQLVYLTNATLHYQKQRLYPHFRTPSLKVVLMDYRDRTPQKRLCTNGIRRLIKRLGKANVRNVVQQIVRNRTWNATNNFVNAGNILDSRQDAECFGRPLLHVPYTVRSDFVQAIESTYRQFLVQKVSSPILLPTPVDTARLIDVAHFWSIRGDEENFCRLRDAVTRVVLSLNGTKDNGVKRPIHTIGRLVSNASAEGRIGIFAQYLRGLLMSKIVVVAQRDSWEDHYRFFEAMAGGALVMTDPMLSLPDALVDGEHVVVYQSLEHLRELILYYLSPNHESERLSIARRGWRMAMEHHRTHHWMEKIFFGGQLSA